MGLVRGVEVHGPPDAAEVNVTLCITEPGCLMSAVFKNTAERELSELPEVESVNVEVDYGYLWDPSDMAPAYRERLERKRAATVARMNKRPKGPSSSGNASRRGIR
jgi:metal-sulfur cluster biosynthetic enzyme